MQCTLVQSHNYENWIRNSFLTFLLWMESYGQSQNEDKSLLLAIKTPGVEVYLQKDPDLLFRHYMLHKEYPKVSRCSVLLVHMEVLLFWCERVRLIKICCSSTVVGWSRIRRLMSNLKFGKRAGRSPDARPSILHLRFPRVLSAVHAIGMGKIVYLDILRSCGWCR